MSVEALIAADDITYLMHVAPPHISELEGAVLVDELAAVKQRWHRARAEHDTGAEAAAVQEWQDLIVLLAAAVDGLADLRRRVAAYDQPKAIILLEGPDRP